MEVGISGILGLDITVSVSNQFLLPKTRLVCMQFPKEKHWEFVFSNQRSFLFKITFLGINYVSLTEIDLRKKYEFG